MPLSEEAKARKLAHKRRMARVAKQVVGMPTTIDTPFFDELKQHWPETPTMAHPVSQLCTAAQFEEVDYSRICKSLGVKPWLHRKQWEFVHVIRSIEEAHVVKPGARGLVFGVGREKLPALFVSRGCKITATDLPMEDSDGTWTGGPQHAVGLDNIFYRHLVDRKTFDANAEFRGVNMKAIPEDLTGYDFCWSSCALEHLGSLNDGFDFIRNSLKCLRPGGVAAHTTEFNLGSATDTLLDGPSVVYRESDLVDFAKEMNAAGHQMTLNLNPGSEPMDRAIDRDRKADIHLRLYVRNKILATSVGLCIRKAA